MSTQTVLNKARRLLGDMGKLFTQQATGDGVTSIFELSHTRVEPASVAVQTSIDNGHTWSGPLTYKTDFQVDGYNGTLMMQRTIPPVGMIVAVRGIAYKHWTDMDMLDFIEIAFLQHTHHRNPPVYLNPISMAVPPTRVLPVAEENLVALLAVVESYWAEATAKADNFTIDTGDGTVIPLGQQYVQIMGHIDKLMARYIHQANLFGVGLYAIEVFNQRRKSRLTGVLVPEYQDQELEQRWWIPNRVLPPIPALADTVVRYRGIFQNGNTYFVNDEVLVGGYTYIAVADNQGVDPATDVESGTGFVGLFWKKSLINDVSGYTLGTGF